MKKRIVSAALAVLTVSTLVACTGTKEPEITTTLSSSATSRQVTTTQATTTTTMPETTTLPVTAAVQTVAEILTTTKKVVSTKPSTTVVTTTLPQFDENKPEDYYRKIEQAFKEDLKYGVFRRRSVTSYIEELADGTLMLVKQDISEYYNRLYYKADFSDLLPAAKENMELYSETIGVVLDIINGYRAEQNISPLALSEELTEIACARAEEIAWSGEHSHRRPNGKSFSSILKDAGITTGIAGENIGWGYETAEDVCTAWKNSESHFENIMNPDFVEIGIGVAADPDPNGKLCWTQIFMSE